MFLTLTALALTPCLVQAEQTPMVNEAGEIKLIEEPGKWRPLNEAEEKAFENPGREIPVNIHDKGYKKTDFWHIAPVKEYSEIIVFGDGKMQTISKAGAIEGQPEFAFYVLFYLAAIIFLAISNILTVVIGRAAFNTFAALAAVLAALAAVLVPTPASVAPIALAAALAAVLAALAAASDDIERNIKLYWIYSFIFYILTVAAMFV